MVVLLPLIFLLLLFAIITKYINIFKRNDILYNDNKDMARRLGRDYD